MKLGIMQPYFLPYLGYWQMIAAVDRYVIYDDVNFIKGGWINRNRMLVNGKPQYFHVLMEGASPNKLICEVGVQPGDTFRTKLLRTIEASYHKAPYFAETFPLMESVIRCQEPLLSNYLAESIRAVCSHLGIETELLLSSTIPKNNALRGQDKVLHLCELLGASEYDNAIGGQALYSREAFAEHGVALRFLKTQQVVYPQAAEEFVSNLSLLDVLMQNGRDGVRELLGAYELV